MTDAYRTPLANLVKLAAVERLDCLARRVRHNMTRRDGVGEFSSVWMAYRAEVEHGPTEYGWGFDHYLEQTIPAFVSSLSPADQLICAVGASWEVDADEAGLFEEPSVWVDLIERAVRSRLWRLADEENSRGVSGRAVV